LADVFAPGNYTLGTHNMPALKTLMGWKYAYHAPFNADVYFISTRQWSGLKWGTYPAIMVRDPEVGQVPVKAFGSYAFQVTDPKTFLEQLVFTDPSFQTVHSPQKPLFDIATQLRDMIVSKVGDVMRTGKVPLFELTDSCEKISNLVLEAIGPSLTTLGLALQVLHIENIALPPEVEQARHMRNRTHTRDVNRYAQHRSGFVFDDVQDTSDRTADADVPWGQPVGPPMTPPGSPARMPVPFFVVVNGAPTGPYHMPALAGKAGDGSLARDTLVWREGMEAWTPAGAVSELRPLFAAVPPLLPFKLIKMTG
jgi:hypothetical protein